MINKVIGMTRMAIVGHEIDTIGEFQQAWVGLKIEKYRFLQSTIYEAVQEWKIQKKYE